MKTTLTKVDIKILRHFYLNINFFTNQVVLSNKVRIYWNNTILIMISTNKSLLENSLVDCVKKLNSGKNKSFPTLSATINNTTYYVKELLAV